MTREKAAKLLRWISVSEHGEVNCRTWYNCIGNDIKEALDMAINTLEQEPKAGHWINSGYSSEEYGKVFECSECFESCIVGIQFKYCPFCGSVMNINGSEDA